MIESQYVLKAKAEGLEKIIKSIKGVEEGLRKTLKTSREMGGARGQMFDRATLKRTGEMKKNLSLLNVEGRITKKQLAESAMVNKAHIAALEFNTKKQLTATTKIDKAHAESLQFTITSQERLRGAELKRLKEIRPELENVTEATKVTRRTFMRTADGIKQIGEQSSITTRDVSKFRMELLSTMFAGMQLSKWMDDHIKRTRDMIGMTALHEAAMTQLMLPAQMDMANMYREIDEAILGLTEDQRRLFGWFVQGGRMVGGLMFQLSQLGLAWQGLEKLGLTKLLTAPIGLMKGMGRGVFGGAKGVMGARPTGRFMLPGGKGIEKSWKFFTKRLTGLFRKLGTGLSDTGMFGATALVSRVWEGMQWLGAALVGVFSWAVKGIGELIASFGIGTKIGAIGSAVVNFFGTITTKVSNWFETHNIGGTMLTAIGKVKDFITGIGSNIKGWLQDNTIIQAMISGAKTIVTAIITLFGMIATAITGAASAAFLKIRKVAGKAFGGVLGALGLKKAAGFFGGKVGGKIGGVAAKVVGPKAAGMLGKGAKGIGSFLSKMFKVGNPLLWGTLIGELGLPESEEVKKTIQAKIAEQKEWWDKAKYALLGAPSYIGALFGDVGRSITDFISGIIPFQGGGIVTKPTIASLAEKGQPEAVIPLDRLTGLGETTVYINIDARLATDYDLENLANRIRLIFESETRAGVLR